MGVACMSLKRRRVCRENGDVIGGVRQRREQVGSVRGTAAEIVWLVNDCHSATTESNLGKSVLDGVVMSSISVFMAANKSMSIFLRGCRESCFEAV